MCSVLGAANVAPGVLAARAHRRRTSGRASWLTVGFAFTTHWWVAGMAGGHHWAQVVAVFFLLVTLHLAVGRRWPVPGRPPLGAGSRLTPAGWPSACRRRGLLRGPVGRHPTRASLAAGRHRRSRPCSSRSYNLARFGSPFDFGYAHIPSGETGIVTDEPWFRDTACRRRSTSRATCTRSSCRLRLERRRPVPDAELHRAVAHAERAVPVLSAAAWRVRPAAAAGAAGDAQRAAGACSPTSCTARGVSPSSAIGSSWMPSRS